MSILGRRRRSAAGTLEPPAPAPAKRKLAAYPEPPPKRLTGMAATRYSREIAASVRDRTCPLLITKAEAKAALWVQRLPETLVSATFYLGDTPARELYRAEDVRLHLIDPDFAARAVKPEKEGIGEVASGEPRVTADLSEAAFAGSPDFEGSPQTHPRLGGEAEPGSADGLAVLKWQETDPDPIRRVVAAEARAAQEDFLRRGVAHRLPPIPEFARLRPPENPDPKTLGWDADKRAFRFTSPPTESCVDCGGKTVFGGKIECGLCDGRAEAPRRFQPGVWISCRYCGAGGVEAAHICDRCKELKRGAITAGITADDRILLYVQKALKAEDYRRLAGLDAEEEQRRRARNRQQTERRWRQPRARQTCPEPANDDAGLDEAAE